MIALCCAAAWATSGFDAVTPAVRLEGDETWTADHSVRIWNAVERWEDPDRSLFHAEQFNDGTEWPAQADWAPWIAQAFGTPTPHSSAFLLHVGVHEETATGTPILFVPGAGDNGTRAWVTMGTHFDQLNRPVYALTFAHPHGDVFAQAEVIADAIAVITERTGAAQVDVVAHSKGGIAAVVYASDLADASWPSAPYVSIGTRYRGDVRRLVLIATPLGGIDTAYRWPAANLLMLDPDMALAPTSWSKYWPYGTVTYGISQDLSRQDFLPAGGDLFPGQRQLLARQDHELPGSLSWLQGYAVQPDWSTTYEGGLGFTSQSSGIDAAIDAGGNLISRLHGEGVDADIGVFLLAGTNPLMPNGDPTFAERWDGVATKSDWSNLVGAIDDHGIPLQADDDELNGLVHGKLVLGECTGTSDGVVFVEGALDEAAVNGRGAVVETKRVDLSHVDLLYASPITGQLLIDSGNDDPTDDGWMRAVGARYTTADTIGWVEDALADEPIVDTDVPQDTDATGTPEDTDRTPAPRPCGGCDTGGTSWGLAVLGAALLLRTRRPARPSR